MAEERSMIHTVISLRTEDDRRNLESVPKFTADPRATVFSKPANPLDLPLKSLIHVLFKTESVDLKTYSHPHPPVKYLWSQLDIRMP